MSDAPIKPEPDSNPSDHRDNLNPLPGYVPPAPGSPPRRSLHPSMNMSSRTPSKHTYSGVNPNRTTTKLQTEQNVELERDLRGHFLGPMPPQSFLNTFLSIPPDADRTTYRLGVFKNVLGGCASEEEMYPRFIRAAKEVIKKLAIVDTHSHAKSSQDRLRPDVVLYAADDSRTSATDLSLAECIIEFKWKTDPFVDKIPKKSKTPLLFPFERNSKAARDARGQVGAYVGSILNTQYRSHVFTSIVFGEQARLMRWDASGIVVSEAFDYTQTEYLSEFLWRYDRSSPAVCGHDCTVRAFGKIEDGTLPIACNQLSDKNPNHSMFLVVKVPKRGNAESTIDFIVSHPPAAEPRGPLGRMTRSTLAYDTSQGKIVFLKQYWRTTSQGSLKEGEVYARLTKAGVRHLPKFGVGDDVQGCRTLTTALRRQDLPWAQRTHEMVEFQLYRMSLNTVGTPLAQFPSTAVMVTAIRDAMICHDDAYFAAKILHRDVSPSNILIDSSDNSGMLADWDMCIDLDNVDREPRRPFKSQFVSIAVMERPGATHDLFDDRESAFWVVVWMALHFAAHNRVKILDDLLGIFDGYVVPTAMLTAEELPEVETGDSSSDESEGEDLESEEEEQGEGKREEGGREAEEDQEQEEMEEEGKDANLGAEREELSLEQVVTPDAGKHKVLVHGWSFRKNVTFANGLLEEFINDLRLHCRARYVDNETLTNGPNSSAPPFKRGDFVAVFDNALAKTSWPAHDRAREHPTSKHRGRPLQSKGKKRAVEDDEKEPESRQKQKSARLARYSRTKFKA